MPALMISSYSESTRFGGAWMRADGPRTSRVTAITAASSSSSASGLARIAVSGLARKFWMITSWMPWYCRATRRIANSASARSSYVSPIPISTPVVNGTALRPASSNTRRRTAGSLSGEPKCGPPGSDQSRVAVVSSIMPIDAATGFSRWNSVQLSTPGFRCGSRPVSSSTRIDIARTYARVSSYPCASSHSRASGQRSSGRSPRVNSASLQPSAAP